MNKQKFNNIVSNPDVITSSDVEALNELANSFPYSQIIHTLNAKAQSISKNSDSQKAVSTAAMYATDRQVLKELVLSQPKVETKVVPVDKAETTVQKTKKVLPKHKKITIDVSSFKNESQEVRNSIWLDLEKLKVSKAHYVEYLDREELKEQSKKVTTPAKKSSKSSVKKESVKKATTNSEKITPAKKKSTTPVKKQSTSKTSDTKSKAQKVVKSTSTTKKAAAKSTAVKKAPAKAPTSKAVKSKESEKEIKKKPNKLQKLDKVEEQIHLIDEFIEKKPSISSKKVTSVETSQEDLSEKSTNFGDDLISENLALILKDQGKVQKALEMYKKLIWKFPQKKSYFAAQIEELKK